MADKIVRYQDRTRLPAHPVVTAISVPASAQGPPPAAFLRRQGWVVLAGVLLGAAGGFAWLHLATPVYRGQAVLTVDPSGAALGESTESFLYRQRQVVLSTPVLGQALARLDTAAMATFADAPGALERLRERLTVEVGDRLEMLQIRFEAPRPDEAVLVVERVVEAYVGQQVERTDDSTDQERQVLQEELDRRDLERQQTRQKMEAFDREHGEVAFEHGQGQAVMARVQQLTAAITAAEERAAAAAAVRARAGEMMTDSDGVRDYLDARRNADQDVIGEGYWAMRAERDSLVKQLEDPRQNRTERHPKVIKWKERIRWLDVELARTHLAFRSPHLVALDEARRAAVAESNRLRSDLADAQARLAAVNRERRERKARAAEYEQWRRDIEQIEKMRAALYERINAMAVRTRPEGVHVETVEPARAGSRPVRPDPLVVLGAALPAGLALGLVAALVRHGADRGRTRPEDRAAGSPVLTVVPRINGDRALQRCARIVQLEPDQAAAGALRSAGTSIAFTMDGQGAQSLLVTSPVLGDGRTTVASNLAIALAETGRPVLLIDADLRRPALHGVHAAGRATGLTDVLAGVDLGQAITPSDDVTNLSVLTAGAGDEDPGTLLAEAALDDLLARACEDHAYVVIDAPPVLAAPEVTVLARRCDATVVVLRATRPDGGLNQQAWQALVQASARVLGVIANAADAPPPVAALPGPGDEKDG